MFLAKMRLHTQLPAPMLPMHLRTFYAVTARNAPTRLLGRMILLAALCMGTPVFAGAGIDAYNQGDWERAWRALEGQAQKGDAYAQFYVGKMYEGGLGRPADPSRAVYWYTQSAAKGHAEARAALAALRAGAAASSAGATGGQPVPCDSAQRTAIQARADDGDADSAAQLALAYESTACGTPDFAAAARYYGRAAEKNHLLALNNLGALYYDGRGVEQDYPMAQKFYAQAAEAGYAIAQYNLALMLGQGRGQAPDAVGMLAWLNKSADQGYARAQAQLGRFYLEGAVVDKNTVKAAQLFLAAAQQGLPNAQYFYGQLVSTGVGVTRDLPTAADWILRAADAGLPIAQQEAATIFELGMGRRADAARAVALYRKAGEAGVKEAALRLAQAYARGELGLRPNPGEAQRWAERAK